MNKSLQFRITIPDKLFSFYESNSECIIKLLSKEITQHFRSKLWSEYMPSENILIKLAEIYKYDLVKLHNYSDLSFGATRLKNKSKQKGKFKSKVIANPNKNVSSKCKKSVLLNEYSEQKIQEFNTTYERHRTEYNDFIASISDKLNICLSHSKGLCISNVYKLITNPNVLCFEFYPLAAEDIIIEKNWEKAMSDYCSNISDECNKLSLFKLPPCGFQEQIIKNCDQLPEDISISDTMIDETMIDYPTTFGELLRMGKSAVQYIIQSWINTEYMRNGYYRLPFYGFDLEIVPCNYVFDNEQELMDNCITFKPYHFTELTAEMNDRQSWLEWLGKQHRQYIDFHMKHSSYNVNADSSLSIQTQVFSDIYNKWLLAQQNLLFSGTICNSLSPRVSDIDLINRPKWLQDRIMYETLGRLEL